MEAYIQQNSPERAAELQISIDSVAQVCPTGAEASEIIA